MQKSPPLRKGKYANPKGKAEGLSDGPPSRSSDPGMVIAFDSKVRHCATVPLCNNAFCWATDSCWHLCDK